MLDNLKNMRFLVDIKSADGSLTTTRLVRVEKIRDGGMVEYYDPDSGDFMGCAGIRTFENGVKDGTIGIVK